MRLSWPVGLIIFFAVFISSMVGFVIWSTHQNEDLVAANYYDQELRYQQHIDAAARVQAAGLTPTVKYEAAANTLRLQFPAADDVQAATGTVTLYRPSEAALDRTFAFAPDASGAQTIAAPLAAGLWRVKTEWYRGGQMYYTEDAVMVP